MILEGVKRLGIVFLLLLLRGFLSALDGGLSAWLLGAWVDVSVVFVIVTVATLRWWLIRYSCDEKSVAIKGGFLFSIDKRIPIEKISSVVLEQPLTYRVFGAARVRFNTLSNAQKHADISLVLPDNIAQEILDNLSTREKKILTPKFSYIIMLSALLSDSLAGAGLVAVSITRLGVVVGEQLEQRVTHAIDSLLHYIPSGLPPIAKTIAVTILFGWLVGFLLNLIRHYNFTIIRNEKTLITKAGVFTKRTSSVKIDDINFINIRQGLFAKLLGIYTVFAHLVGIGRKKGDITTITPAGTLFTIQKSLKEILPEYKPSKITLCPDKRAFLGFVADPLWILIPLVLLTALLVALTQIPRKILLSLATFVSIPAVWWLLVRIADLFCTGIGIGENNLTIRYSSSLKFNTVLTKRENVISVKLRQSLFQRTTKRCDVFVYTKGETAYRHRIRNVDIKKARKLLRF